MPLPFPLLHTCLINHPSDTSVGRWCSGCPCALPLRAGEASPGPSRGRRAPQRRTPCQRRPPPHRGLRRGFPANAPGKASRRPPSLPRESPLPVALRRGQAGNRKGERGGSGGAARPTAGLHRPAAAALRTRAPAAGGGGHRCQGDGAGGPLPHSLTGCRSRRCTRSCPRSCRCRWGPAGRSRSTCGWAGGCSSPAAASGASPPASAWRSRPWPRRRGTARHGAGPRSHPAAAALRGSAGGRGSGRAGG